MKAPETLVTIGLWEQNRFTRATFKTTEKNNQHVLAISLLAKEHVTSHGEGPSTYAPIVQALTRLPENEKARLERMFDKVYLVATESMSFLKYPVICKLEKRHGLISVFLTPMNTVVEHLYTI